MRWLRANFADLAASAAMGGLFAGAVVVVARYFMVGL
jgi:hypothetical protein